MGFDICAGTKVLFSCKVEFRNSTFFIFFSIIIGKFINITCKYVFGCPSDKYDYLQVTLEHHLSAVSLFLSLGRSHKIRCRFVRFICISINYRTLSLFTKLSRTQTYTTYTLAKHTRLQLQRLFRCLLFNYWKYFNDKSPALLTSCETESDDNLTPKSRQAPQSTLLFLYFSFSPWLTNTRSQLKGMESARTIGCADNDSNCHYWRTNCGLLFGTLSATDWHLSRVHSLQLSLLFYVTTAGGGVLLR